MSEIYNVPIDGFKKYSINTITHEITNGRGKIIKQRLDNRGTLITNLVDDSGKQRTVRITQLVEKVYSSLENKESSDAILREVLVTYYKLFDDDFKYNTLQDMSKEVAKHVHGIDIVEIGKIINKIY
jgi:hypothetical protein